VGPFACQYYNSNTFVCSGVCLYMALYMCAHVDSCTTLIFLRVTNGFASAQLLVKYSIVKSYPVVRFQV
jgi:hypothetical protein